MATTFPCIRCGRMTTAIDIHKSDGLCTSCDGTYDPVAHAAEVAAAFPPKSQVLCDHLSYNTTIIEAEIDAFARAAVLVDRAARAAQEREALRELVRLKGMKERMEQLQRGPLNTSKQLDEYYKLKAEYDVCKNKAWKAARKALGE